MTATRTTCPYCGVGCGILARSGGAGAVEVRGDPEHPANRGRLCSKGAALGETTGLEGRLLQPEVAGQPVDWDTALDTVAEGLQRALDAHGPDAVGFYLSGQLLTEDYYVANKLAKGFLGTAHVDTNSRLCMASAVAGHKRAFGADVVPGCYEDLELADLVVLVGSNLAWCHPVLYQRLKAAKARRPELRVVVIDPRRTDSCEIADLHLPIRPGRDVRLFNALLAYLAAQGAVSRDYLDRHTRGWPAALAAAHAEPQDMQRVAADCGLPLAELALFLRWFAATERTVTVYSQGVNQSSAGTDKVNAIINCHLASGRIGRPGMGPFSVTGQPNAMGGREVGGLANTLAAHMDFEPAAIARVREYWNAPRMARRPGLKAVELFRAAAEGRIKALWIMGTNPVVSLPDADLVRRALKRCELVIASDCERATDTVALAHVRLPALAWGEKDGTVTNSERCISRQRGFLPAPGAARADWWALVQVARRLGFGGEFDYQRPQQIFIEHAGLTACDNEGSRLLDLGALAGLTAVEYDALQPVQWPVPERRPQGTARLFGAGGFVGGEARARLQAVRYRAPAHVPSPDYPLVLNTGRIRDQWHTMTRSGKSARLAAHTAEPFAQLHPRDAAALGIGAGDLVELESRWGRARLRALLDDGQQPGSVFAPMHWSDQFASLARIDAAVNPATDPLSGEPEFKHTPVRVRRLELAWHGFLLCREPLGSGLPVSYWVRSRGQGHWRYELAGTEAPDWWAWLRRELGGAGEWMRFRDPAAGCYRVACVREHRLQACLFVAPRPNLPERGWLGELFERDPLAGRERLALLSGVPPAGEERGRTVCACFQVGEHTIRAAIAEGAATAEAVTAICQAGGNCGSCVPEIKALLAAQKVHRRSA